MSATDGASIDAVVFDLGNVLIQWDRDLLYRKVIPDPERRAWFLEHVTDMTWNEALDRGASFDDFVADLSGRHPDWAEEIAAYRDRWVEMLGPDDPAAVAIMRELKASGVGVYALTNWSAETFPFAQERFAWLEEFDGIIVSGREGLLKPEAAIFELLHTRFGLDLERCLFTDDGPGNVDGARAVGMHAEVWTGAEDFRAVLARFGLLSKG